jgi:2',3'-cyclic-nucleotide 2'-phosphodiesterase (5'-nucleotidase family)
VPLLKEQGAQVVVAITHLSYAEDRLLAKRFPQIDVVIGGHEHYPITGMEGRTLISKAGSDARWVARIDIVGSDDGPQSHGSGASRGPGGSPGPTGSARSGAGASSRASLVAKFFELIPITNEIPDEPQTAAVVQEYEERLSGELDTVVGEIAVPLEARSIRLRVGEQPIGNLFADAIRSDVNAEAALINSGSIRGDRVYPPGPLTRRTLLAMHPFGNVVCAVDVTGAVLLAALNNGVAKLPASAGQFPQVSGLTFTVDPNAPPGSRIRNAAVNGQPLVESRRYRVAIPDYVFNGGDGYSMFGGQRVLVGPESGNLLVSVVERFVSAQRQVAPALEGRITMEAR